MSRRVLTGTEQCQDEVYESRETNASVKERQKKRQICYSEYYCSSERINALCMSEV